MRQIHIINPAAGRCKAESFLPSTPVEIYRSVGVGDIERFVFETCNEDPHVHFVAYGGDGTLNEVVNGVMQANANAHARVTIVPTGTGNDFVRNFSDITEPVQVDVLRYNDRFSINMLNTGFDCDVVTQTAKMKKLPLVAGSFAYILGVFATLCRKIGRHFSLEILTAEDEEITIDRNLLLIAAGNGSYCGGGFFAIPQAKTDDALLDLIIINKISRLQFLKLVKDYKAGTYVDAESGKIKDRFRDIITHVRAKKVLIHNMNTICADGEVARETDVAITVIPGAITFVPATALQQEQAATNEEKIPLETVSE